MLFSHHSHSGQFCTHAVSTLEEVVLAAIDRGMTTLAFTEHIPRNPLDLYPGEQKSELLKDQDLFQVFASYHAEAERLRGKYASQIELFVGFEAEWIRPETLDIIRDLQRSYRFDMFVGSLHHVHSHPIDFDDTTLALAREASGGTDELLAAAYYDAQLDMLKALKPPVVGHFDLIRLKLDSSHQDRDWRKWGDDIWEKIVRNLQFVLSYGGVLEVNSAALRKNLLDVYPRREIMQEWTSMGGKLTLSDDSHGVDQLCTNYSRALECVEHAGVKELWFFKRTTSGEASAFSPAPGLALSPAPLADIRARLK